MHRGEKMQDMGTPQTPNDIVGIRTRYEPVLKVWVA